MTRLPGTMPIDIALSTNTSSEALELRQAQPMPDGSGFATLLVVRSGSFAAAHPFFFAGDDWRAFHAALSGLGNGAAEPARLPARAGDDTLEIAPAGDGQLTISGTLHEPVAEQLLRFRFTAPAHGLAAFITSADALA